jgi:hypothetical protein
LLIIIKESPIQTKETHIKAVNEHLQKVGDNNKNILFKNKGDIMRKLMVLILFATLFSCASGEKKKDTTGDGYGIKYYNVTEGTPETEYAIVTTSSFLLMFEINDKRFVSGASGFLKSVFRSKDSDAKTVALLPGRYKFGVYYTSQSAPSFEISFDVAAGHRYTINYRKDGNIIHVFAVDNATGEFVAGKE